jgi:hypothetical protein
MATDWSKFKIAEDLMIVEYHHKHGHDTFVCATDEDAQRTMAGVMLANLSEIDNEVAAREIAGAIASENYEGLGSRWEELTQGNEYFVLDYAQLQKDVEAPKVDLVELFGEEVS